MRILTILMVLVLLAQGVVAQEEVKPGLTPMSKLYGLDRAMERISLAMSSGNAAKAEKRLKRSSERLAELSIMVDNQQKEYANQLMEETDLEMDLAEYHILKEKEAGKDVNSLNTKMAKYSYINALIIRDVKAKVPISSQSDLNKYEESLTKYNQRALSRIERETGKPAGLNEDLAKKRTKS